MRSRKELAVRIVRLLKPLFLALAFSLAAGVGLLWNAREGQAQGGIEVHKQLGRSSPVVRVGEVLTFTIVITNSSGFTLTTVPMTDTYRADILGYAFTVPYPPDASATIGASGLLTWNNIATTTMLGPIIPGQVVSFTIGFTAEHPATAIVNAAGVHDALDESGSLVGGGNSQGTNDAVGGAAPVEKRIEPPGFTPLVGAPLTFTTRITNDGAAVMTVLPYRDIYDPNVLAFSYAIPTPTLILTGSGVISWADLTTYFGDIPADTAVTVTAVFTALPGIGLISTANRAEVQGALDWYNNVLAPGADQAPITIIGEVPTPTPIPKQTGRGGGEEEEETVPTPAPTAAPTPLSTTPTPAVAVAAAPTQEYITPKRLPETGRSVMPRGPALLLAGAALLLAALLLHNVFIHEEKND
jgi:hypothetical protein